MLAVGGDIAHDALAMIEYRSEPAVFILADSEAGLAGWREAAEAAERRVAGATTLAERPPQWPPGHVALLVDAGADDALIKVALDEAERSDRRVALAVSADLIDAAAGTAWHDNVTLLSAPSAAERVQEVLRATAPREGRLNDVGRDGHDVLRRLSEEAGRLASMLASLARTDEPALVRTPQEDAEEMALDPAAIRALIRARRLRDRYFSGALFADPAWDMLLDLMAARLENVPVAVSSLCIASAVPATTALRWIRTLTDHGLFVRIADPHDGRRVFIALSDQAARSLSAYLHAVQRITPTPL